MLSASVPKKSARLEKLEEKIAKMEDIGYPEPAINIKTLRSKVLNYCNTNGMTPDTFRSSKIGTSKKSFDKFLTFPYTNHGAYQINDSYSEVIQYFARTGNCLVVIGLILSIGFFCTN